MQHAILVLTGILLIAGPSPASAAPRVEKNVVYGVYSGLALPMDVEYPEKPNGYGVIFVAGSGWQSRLTYGAPALKERQIGDWGPALLRAGYTVFALNHRAAPRFQFPAPVEDVRRAVRFVRHHASRFGVLGEKLGGVGGSSGGHLIGLVAMTGSAGLADDPDPVNREPATLQCVVLRAAPPDMVKMIGGASLQDYFEGTPRTEDFLRRYGSHRLRWDPPPADDWRPEAEWGFSEELGEDVLIFAKRHGWRVRRIAFEQPEHLSPFVADLYRWSYRQRGFKAERLVIDSFILMDPWWTLRTGAVPFWMVFNKEPSAEALASYLSSREPFDFLHLTLFSHGVESIGLVPMSRWKQLLGCARVRGEFLGVSGQAYPRDFAVFPRYRPTFRSISTRLPVPRPLSERQLDQFLSESGKQYQVEFQELT